MGSFANDHRWAPTTAPTASFRSSSATATKITRGLRGGKVTKASDKEIINLGIARAIVSKDNTTGTGRRLAFTGNNSIRAVGSASRFPSRPRSLTRASPKASFTWRTRSRPSATRTPILPVLPGGDPQGMEEISRFSSTATNSPGQVKDAAKRGLRIQDHAGALKALITRSSGLSKNTGFSSGRSSNRAIDPRRAVHQGPEHRGKCLQNIC